MEGGLKSFNTLSLSAFFLAMNSCVCLSKHGMSDRADSVASTPMTTTSSLSLTWLGRASGFSRPKWVAILTVDSRMESFCLRARLPVKLH